MMATFVVSDVSHHARMRAKERGLPLESLSGGMRLVSRPCASST